MLCNQLTWNYMLCNQLTWNYMLCNQLTWNYMLYEIIIFMVSSFLDLKGCENFLRNFQKKEIFFSKVVIDSNKEFFFLSIQSAVRKFCFANFYIVKSNSCKVSQ